MLLGQNKIIFPFFILFHIFLLFKTATLNNQISIDSKSTDYDPFQLTREELLELNEDYDPGYENDLGKFLGDFFSDSSSPLIIDLDLFKQVVNEFNEMRQAAMDGDVDYIRVSEKRRIILSRGHFVAGL
jgi:hypothetical protein